MAKVAEDAALELELDDERIEVELPWHIKVAVNHLMKRLEKARGRLDRAKAEVERMEAMIAAAKG